MKKRGKRLSDLERCCLLLNAMTTEEARSMVQNYEVGDESYSQALKALREDIGQPCQIYPQHVSVMLTCDDTYSYHKWSLRRMRETVVLSIGYSRVSKAGC